MTPMQATQIRADKKILKKISGNQRSEISFIRVPKKEWNADDADASNADKNGYKNPRKSALENPFYPRAIKSFKI